jgi:formylglycine-generating enzyme required for sulfatase activity
MHQAELSPYFLARHELTQGQWMRLGDGRNPSSHAPPWDRPDDRAEPVTLAHPVENVSFDMCARLLPQHALDLPTEEQWEFACRAGATTPWFTGKTPESLLGYANILDQTAGRAVTQWGEPESIDDGFISHARVGTFKPNAFGLFDVHGNVWEWCHGGTGSPTRSLMRGGGFTGDASDARAAIRMSAQPNIRSLAFGVRPARAILP